LQPALPLLLAACAAVDEHTAPPGVQRCEGFFIYDLCVNDLGGDGDVDFMYFDDTREIFMYARSELEAASQVLPLHPCAIPMSDSTREYSSQLLYGEELPLTQRLALKGRLIANYRKSQPAISACNRTLSGAPKNALDDPFLIQEDWEEGDL
jgi:hypothetical protein